MFEEYWSGASGIMKYLVSHATSQKHVIEA